MTLQNWCWDESSQIGGTSCPSFCAQRVVNFPLTAAYLEAIRRGDSSRSVVMSIAQSSVNLPILLDSLEHEFQNAFPAFLILRLLAFEVLDGADRQSRCAEARRRRVQPSFGRRARPNPKEETAERTMRRSRCTTGTWRSEPETTDLRMTMRRQTPLTTTAVDDDIALDEAKIAVGDDRL